ncbi:dipeptide ABC transporter ATP-binding protein [Devosia albogilva]|uniref:Dipeptide ABC transporter ATP-binding protein n=1 Tax=Devosia albogilva TaxID=429726 RepID=A0ABW5QLH9_9HYPH
MSLLEATGLSVRFGVLEAVADVAFSIAPGERFGIIGESGSGKTMTALAVSGLLPEGAAMSGSIRFDGQPLPEDERTMARLRGKRIGMIFQEPMTALNPLMRIGAQIAEAMRINLPAGEPEGAVLALLEEVGLAPDHSRRFPHQLSGGQRQRVMIAMALASEPDLLIADEPTSALDLITQRLVLDLIAEICERRRMALLFISHDLKAVAALCSRVAVMHRGRMIETGATDAVFRAPREPYTQRLVAATQLERHTGAEAPSGPILLEAEAVTRDYASRRWLLRGPSFRAVDSVSFTLHQGECLALVGPSGCGKTTLARVLVGLDTATSGALRFEGQSYRGADLPAELRRDLSLVFQDPFGSFDPRLTVGQSVGEPLRLERGLDAAARRKRVETAVLAVGLDTAMLDRYPHEFSGGQRQRLAIARALVTRPKLVVLDEPVSALDVSVRGEVLALLARLRAEHGLTYVLISHDLDMVRTMADRVLVMEAGRIVEEGDPDEIFAAPQHRLTQDLVAARLPEVG